MSQPPSASRPPSVSPQMEDRSQSRRGRSRTTRSPSIATESTDSKAPSRRNRRQQRQQQQGGGLTDGLPVVGDSGLPVVGEGQEIGKQVTDTAGGAVNQVGGLAGGLTGNEGGGEKKGGGGRDNPLRLRLDVNLDIKLELRAQVHGDVTLQLMR